MTRQVRTPTAYSHIAADLRTLAFPIADLHADVTNAKVHGNDSIDGIAESYRRHGQVKPLIGRRLYRGAQNVVVAGNGGLLAARRLGWPTLAVLWLPDSVSDDAVRDFAYRDNLTHEPARWNEDQLRADADAGLDLLALGFSSAGLSDLLGIEMTAPTFEPTETDFRLDRLSPHCATCRCREVDGA